MHVGGVGAPIRENTQQKVATAAFWAKAPESEAMISIC